MSTSTPPLFIHPISGNVGIGTTIIDTTYAYAKLQVEGPAFFNNNGAFGGMALQSSGYSRYWIGCPPNANVLCIGGNGGYPTTPGVINITATNGYVGIGTAAPSGLLEINANSGLYGAGEPTYKGDIRIMSNGGTSTLVDGNGGIEFKSAISGNGYGWRIVSTDTFVTGVHLSIQNRDNSATWKNTMVIKQGGYVGIGSTSPTHKLDVVSDPSGNTDLFRVVNINPAGTIGNGIRFWNTNIFGPTLDNSAYLGYSGYRWVNVYAANGTIQTSDEKEKIYEPLTYGLSDVMNIETIKYRWKSQEDLPDTDPMKSYQYYGFKASNLQDIFPELVYNDTDILQVNYSELLPVLVNAIKEQKNMIDALTERLNNAGL